MGSGVEEFRTWSWVDGAGNLGVMGSPGGWESMQGEWSLGMGSSRWEVRGGGSRVNGGLELGQLSTTFGFSFMVMHAQKSMIILGD